MFSSAGKRHAPLVLVADADRRGSATDAARPPEASPQARDLDWSILMARAQAGEHDAYRRLLEDIAPYVRSLAAKCHRNPSDAEDCVQDVLLTVHAVRHTYDPTRPFGPWLAAIARRRIVDRLRRQWRAALRETPLTDAHETIAVADVRDAETRSVARAVREAVDRLPAAQREAVTLVKLQERSLKEAAGISGMSVAALKTATHRAVKRLRTMLAERSNDA